MFHIARENEKKEEEEVIAEDYDERDRDRLGGPDDDDPMNIANLEKKFQVCYSTLFDTFKNTVYVYSLTFHFLGSSRVS